MAHRQRIAVLVCVVVAAVWAVPGPGATQEDDSQLKDYVPPRFSGFERFDEWKAQAVHREYGAKIVQCDEIPEPVINEKYPSWTVQTINNLKKTAGVKQLVDETTGTKRNAYVKGTEIVVKTCSFIDLRAAVEHTTPAHSAKKGDTNPKYDIYLHCGTGSHVINFQHHLEFGASSRDSKGVFSLKAPDQNVELNGKSKTRMLLIRKGAHLTVFGLTFKLGKEVNWSPDNGKNYPAGGYNGGAILVNFSGALTAYKCRFLKNKAYSYHARWGGGGAIKAETASHVIIWGCYFEGNRAGGGGAVGASSATIVHIARSTFYKNVAVGGLDDNGRVLVHGAALRVDSVHGHEKSLEHVLICNSELTSNKLVFRAERHLARYGGKYPEDVDLLRVQGAGIAAWNKVGKLTLDAGDHHFLTMKGCTMKNNLQKVTPSQHDNRELGTYVFQTEGAGHVDMRDLKFVNNSVRKAVCKFDNSNRFEDGIEYELLLKGVTFQNNGNVANLAFEAKVHDSNCEFQSVSGMPDGSGDCAQELQEAEDIGDPVIID